jgi:tetratricopeptide (TPR) repeat protein
MMRKWMVTGTGLLWVALGLTSGLGKVWAAPQAPQDQSKPGYTLQEYNDYQAASKEQNPQQKIKLLDDFVKKYPNSTLMPYVYRDYYTTYMGLKNFGQTIEYADRMIALGEKIDASGRWEAYYTRAQAFYYGSGDKTINTPDGNAKARDAAIAGLKTIDELKKPDNVEQGKFDELKAGGRVLFNAVAALASTNLKDYPAAVNYYKAVLVDQPNDAVTHYRLGIVYLQMNPPQGTDGFWELARAVDLKISNDAQVRAYLKNQIVRYQQPACDKLVDDQVNELLTLANGATEKPATLNVPSAADLQKARDDTANFIPALKGGGDAGKVMWLASCGLEYPDVGVRVMEPPTVDGDTVTLKVFRGATPEEIEAATESNMTVKIEGQPEAKKLEKDAVVRFTGTLTGYSQNPFMLTWEKGKINPEDLPEEKAAPAKKGPAKKAPAKKAPAGD